MQRDNKLFTFGFSQGAHAALALHRKLQNDHVNVTATATVGGVFDVERFFLSSDRRPRRRGRFPLYISYMLLAYDDIYNVYGHASDVFRQPYALPVPGLFDMQHFFDDILAGPAADLARSPQAVVLREREQQPEQSPPRPSRQNAVDQWRPAAPTASIAAPTTRRSSSTTRSCP